MHKYTGKLSLTSKLLHQRGFGAIGEIIRRKAWSADSAFMLRRDMAVAFCAPEASIPIRVRPATARDLQQLLDLDEPGLSPEEREDRSWRLQMATAGFASCFVAVTDDDQPCYMQWMITPQENDLLRRSLHGLFPPLAPDETLLEGAYTPEAFRGKRIMPAAMALLAEQAGEMGARWVVTYVGEANVASLKGCKRAGFAPYRRKRALWRLGRCRTTVHPLPAGASFPLDVSTTGAQSPERATG